MLCLCVVSASVLGCSGGKGASVSVDTGNSKVAVSANGVDVKTEGESGAASVSVNSGGVSAQAGGNQVKVSGNGVEARAEDGSSVTVKAESAEGAPKVEAEPAEGEQATVKVEADGDSAGSVTTDAGSVVISGASEEHVIDGQGKQVVISGASNKVVITGQCAGLVVSGTSNNISLETAPTIEVSGTDNEIAYKSGEPKVDNTGFGNKVEKK